MQHARLRTLLIALGFCFLSIGWSNSASQTVETQAASTLNDVTELQGSQQMDHFLYLNGPPGTRPSD